MPVLPNACSSVSDCLSQVIAEIYCGTRMGSVADHKDLHCTDIGVQHWLYDITSFVLGTFMHIAAPPKLLLYSRALKCKHKAVALANIKLIGFWLAFLRRIAYRCTQIGGRGLF